MTHLAPQHPDQHVLLLLPITAKVKAHELRGKNKQELLQQVGVLFQHRPSPCPAAPSSSLLSAGQIQTLS